MAEVVYRRQRAILDFVTQYIQKNGYAPSLRTIADAVGLSSLATVHEHLQRLTEKGILKRIKRKGSIRFARRNYLPGRGAVDLPVLGYIAAGQPIETYTQPGVTFQIAPNLISGKKRAYVLQVKGDSLIEEGILDGDFVVIEEDSEIRNGDIVVALLDNGLATLKRFFKEETRIRLEPANAKMAPMFVTNLTIQGKVKSVIRKYP